jgi:hypothetical protein
LNTVSGLLETALPSLQGHRRRERGQRERETERENRDRDRKRTEGVRETE